MKILKYLLILFITILTPAHAKVSDAPYPQAMNETYEIQRYEDFDEMISQDQFKLILAAFDKEGLYHAVKNISNEGVQSRILALEDFEIQELTKPLPSDLKILVIILKFIIYIPYLALIFLISKVGFVFMFRAASSGEIFDDKVNKGSYLITTLAAFLLIADQLETGPNDISVIDSLIISQFAKHMTVGQDIAKAYSDNIIINLPAVSVPHSRVYSRDMSNLVDALIEEKANRKSDGQIDFNFIYDNASLRGVMVSDSVDLSISVKLDQSLIKKQRELGNTNFEIVYVKKLVSDFEHVIVKANKVADNIVQNGRDGWFLDDKDFSWIEDSCLDYENVDLKGTNLSSVRKYQNAVNNCLSQDLISRFVAFPSYKYTDILREKYGLKHNYVQACTTGTDTSLTRTQNVSMDDIENCMQSYCSLEGNSSPYACAVATQIYGSYKLKHLMNNSGYFKAFLNVAYQDYTKINVKDAQNSVSSLAVLQEPSDFKFLNDFKVTVPTSFNSEFNYSTYIDFMNDQGNRLVDSISTEITKNFSFKKLLTGNDGFVGIDRFLACHEHPNGYADGWACGSLLSEINRLGDNIMIAGTAGLSGAVALSALSKSTGKSKVGKLLKTKSFTQILRKNSLVTATAFTAGTGVAVNEMLNSYENTNFDYFYGFDDSFTNNAPDAALLFVAMLAADKFNMTELLTSIMFYFVFIGFMLSVVIPLLPYFFSLNSLKETLTALLEGIIGITVSLMYTIIPSKATRSEYLAQAGMLFVRTILVVVFNVMGLLVAIIAFNLLSMAGFFNIFKPHMSVASLADSIIMIGMLLVLVIMTYKKFNMIFGIVTEAVEQSVFLMKGNFQLSNYQMYMDGLKQADMIAKRAKMNIK